MWEYYRLDFNASTTTSLTNQNPKDQWIWDANNASWLRRSKTNAPINLSDASGNIFLQVDTASTDVGTNACTNNDINIKGAAIAEASTATFGGRFDTASTAVYFASIQAVGSAARKSVTMTNTPPSIRVSWDKNTTSIGFVSVFVGFNKEYNK